MEFLTENIVKRAALKFLKSYYKFRLRQKEVQTVSKLDVRTDGGIIADGFYSFRKPDGSFFTSTFEASSYLTRHEIKYRMQNSILFWDGLAISSLVTALLFSFLYTNNYLAVKDIGLVLTSGICLISIVSVFLAFRLIAGQFHRYRYIYAVEQFKRYHADEQWVAYGEDVFENSDDKYLNELKTQCVRNGFGLIKVDKKLEPHVLITPSRHEVFKGKRQTKSFFTQNKWVEKMEFKNSPSWWRKILNFLKNSDDPGSVLRFQRSFWSQFLVSLIAFSFIGVIFYREILDADLIHLDRTEYLEDLSNLEKEGIKDPEEALFVVDTSINVKVDTQEWWMDEDNENYQQTINPENSPDSRNVIINDGVNGKVTYDCSRFYNLNGKKYIVIDGLYGNSKDALARLTILENQGLSAGILWLGCFAKNETDYALYLNEFYKTEKDALVVYENFSTMEEVNFNNLAIREIELIE